MSAAAEAELVSVLVLLITARPVSSHSGVGDRTWSASCCREDGQLVASDVIQHSWSPWCSLLGQSEIFKTLKTSPIEGFWSFCFLNGEVSDAGEFIGRGSGVGRKT